MEEKTKTYKPLHRSEKERMLGGVASGIGLYFDVDPNLVRFMFLLITLLGGSGVLLYIILWILIPSESSVKGTYKETIRTNMNEIKDTAQDFIGEIPRQKKKLHSQSWFGIFLILLGGLFLLHNFGMLWWFSMEKMWPAILILLGAAVLLRHE